MITLNVEFGPDTRLGKEITKIKERTEERLFTAAYTAMAVSEPLSTIHHAAHNYAGVDKAAEDVICGMCEEVDKAMQIMLRHLCDAADVDHTAVLKVWAELNALIDHEKEELKLEAMGAGKFGSEAQRNMEEGMKAATHAMRHGRKEG